MNREGFVFKVNNNDYNPTGGVIMFKYLFRSREGQFLVLGIIFTMLGFLFIPIHSTVSTIAFYMAIFFSGYFATIDALVYTFKERRANVDLLMILSAIGAAMINYESEGAMLLIIFAGAEVLEDYASAKTTSEISELMSRVPNEAQLILPEGDTKTVLTETLKIDDLVLVARGAQIPIDGYADRTISVNEAALTGESVPVTKNKDDEVFAGTINEGNAFQLKVSKTSDETVFSNIIQMVKEAQNRPSRISKFIDRFESRYVITVLIVVPLFVLFLYYINGYGLQEAIYRGLVLLTVASPCALVASATPATLSAISNGAKNGVLFKGGAAMEALSTMNELFTDKTGTLTFGEFSVVDYEADEESIAYAVYMEHQSTHPIAKAIVNHFNDANLSVVDQSLSVEEVAGAGLQMGGWLIGKRSIFKNHQGYKAIEKQINNNYTTVVISKDHVIKGYFVLADEIRYEAKKAVNSFINNDVEVTLLTGDNDNVANIVGKELGLDHIYASLKPEDKIRFVREEQEKDKIVGMIGDGINDAPALANADIGIAMGSGSSVAMESSDVIIVKNNLNKLFYSYELSKRLNKIILQNVIFAVSVIIILIILNLLGILDLPSGVIAHEGSTLLVIFNGLRLLKTKD